MLVFLLSSQCRYKYGVEADESLTTSAIKNRLKERKKNTEALVVGAKEVGLEVDADKTKYVVVY